MEAPCTRFTAAEGGTRLASAAAANNTLAVEYAAFISTRLIYEDAYKIRGSLFEGSQRSVYVTRAPRVDVVSYELSILTDLAVTKALHYGDVYDWCAEMETKEVLVCTSTVLKQILEEEVLSMSNINVLVIDSCHMLSKDENLQFIMRQYKAHEEDKRPRILALTYPLFSSSKKEGNLEKVDEADQNSERTDNNADDNDASVINDDPNTKETKDNVCDQANSELESILERKFKLVKISDTNSDKIDKRDDETVEASKNDNRTVIKDENELGIVEISKNTAEKVIKESENVIKTEDSSDNDSKKTLEADNEVETGKLGEENENNVKVDEKLDEETLGVYENLDDFEMYEKLEWKIEELEQAVCCQMDLAEDIDGGKRLSASVTKPKELIIEYSSLPSRDQLPAEFVELETFMKDTVYDAVAFLEEHRYDPTEIYGEDLYEEFKNIPDPSIEPKFIFKQFLYVLDQLGPYAADKAAFSLLTKLEKLKIKVPYERHFLLLCLCTSVLVKIRCEADTVFSKFENDWEKIKTFSTPKVLRFAEILEKFSPDDSKAKINILDGELNTARDVSANKGLNKIANDNSKAKKPNRTKDLLNTIEECDFKTLSDKIEDRINVIESNLKDIAVDERVEVDDIEKYDNNCVKPNSEDNIDGKLNTEVNIINTIDNKTSDSEGNIKTDDSKDTLDAKDNEKSCLKSEQNRNENDNSVHSDINNLSKVESRNVVGFTRRTGHRSRGRGRAQRSNASRAQLMQLNPDALCGIVFVKEALMAKIMFMLIVDMSRSRPSLSHVCAQYCAVETKLEPDEAKEWQRQGKKQEDVLKKFRIHECNLLLATSALEEGIDLPRCNLVLRWDLPPSYRSYGLCRSRARATRASCAVLASSSRGDTPMLLHNVAVYKELDQIISRKCGCGIQDEPPQSEEEHADSFTHIVKAYAPSEKDIACKKDKDTKIDESVKENDEIYERTDDITDDKINLTRHSRNKFSESVDLSVNNNCNKCNSARDSVNIVCQCVGEDASREFRTECNTVVGEKVESGRTEKIDSNIASVDLSSAIALINRYCGKLPSDTFTRLAPQWWMEEVVLKTNTGIDRKAYVCTLRLPLNCPVKYNIVGHPMPTRVLARRIVALQACRILHKSGELDNQLMPIGKENFKAADLDTANSNVGDVSDPNDSARPGTTKRRQYYYKRTAWAFTDCQPVVDHSDSEIDPKLEAISGSDKQMDKETAGESETVKYSGKMRNMLYAIVSWLWCALPERYNTRGRRLHAPQRSHTAIGVLMAREHHDDIQIPSFPVYTRSGEVRVCVQYVPDADVRMSPRRGRLVRRFMRFVFSEVLRVRRRGMKLQSEGSTHNNYYIVPTVKSTREDGTIKIDIDWDFLELIYRHTEEKKLSEIEKPNLFYHEDEGEQAVKKVEKNQVKKLVNPLLKEGETFVFDAEKYREAVVTPWYRNQDQPQFFLVAEICWNLTPDSGFPSAAHTTFREYYSAKYGVTLTQSNQPLLDVDHTSNRLNLLTPRYVNRKGVALPVSSERTRRAKRDRLDQKQILVPELCRVHPFAAPLWFATVALPCVLYRINALLIADEIRRSVAIDVGLGIPKIDEMTYPGFKWPPLDFGWSLAEVLNADSEKNEKNKKEEEVNREEGNEVKLEENQEKNLQHKEINDAESSTEQKERTINEILQEKEMQDSSFEIGTWSNDMASSIPQDEYDEYMEPLPSNLTFCTSVSGGTNWCDPIDKPKSQFQPSNKYAMADSDCSYMSSDFDTDDSDLNSDVSDDDTDTSGFCSSKNSNAAMGVRIEYKTAREAEAVDLESKKKVRPAPPRDSEDDLLDKMECDAYVKGGDAPVEYVEKFRKSVAQHEKEILENGCLIKENEELTEILPDAPKPVHEKATKDESRFIVERMDVKNKSDEIKITNKDISETVLEKSAIVNKTIEEGNDKEVRTKLNEPKTRDELINKQMNSKTNNELECKTKELIDEIFPYGETNLDIFVNGQINLENVEKNKRILLEELKKTMPKNELKKMNCFSMKDVDIDSPDYVNEKIANVGFDSKDSYVDKVNKFRNPDDFKPYYMDGKNPGKEFDFDFQPNLDGHPGPSPSVILQALTMSNANDGINLERLETIGDSFLKFAITAYLYCAHPAVHEGKLSHMRSKQVSNLNLYRLGRNKRLGTRMIASKFEPHDNWLPPCHKPPSTLHPKTNESNEQSQPNEGPIDSSGCFIPYNLITQHSIPDKSIADCVEALIGAYLLECGPRGALLFMSWLGIRVLPRHQVRLPDDHPYVMNMKMGSRKEEKPQAPQAPPRRCDQTESDTDEGSDDEGRSGCGEAREEDWTWPGRSLGSLRPVLADDGYYQTVFGELKAPPSPLLRYIEDPEGELERMLSGYEALERTLQYRFKDRSLLLQALTHASHQDNRLTDCYQRLEFLGDAILDYLITRHLYEDPRRHSPGALTDLRSALVNNTIFATLAARHGFHKYFRHMSSGLNEVLTKYVKIQEENGHSISEEHYLIQEDEMEQAEDVEVPKALGDLFESVAGAIFLDSGMSLGAVWKSYVSLMGAELEAFSAAAPKSPVRELLEAEPDTAKFGKPERLADGRRVRVCVEVFGRGAFKGVGRNYRIAKGTAARCALRHLKLHRR